MVISGLVTRFGFIMDAIIISSFFLSVLYFKEVLDAFKGSADDPKVKLRRFVGINLQPYLLDVMWNSQSTVNPTAKTFFLLQNIGLLYLSEDWIQIQKRQPHEHVWEYFVWIGCILAKSTNDVLRCLLPCLSKISDCV